jgi:hypothetical protein
LSVIGLPVACIDRQKKRGRPRWTASGTPNPPFPSEWSQYSAILSADCRGGKGAPHAFPFTVL